MLRKIPLALLCLALLHALVDTCALLIGPLWAELNQRFQMSETTLFVVLTVAVLSPSLSQAVFGYIRDRCPTRFLLWLGPVMAAVCISLVGIASSVPLLCTFLILGGIGVGAFHPEAAVAAGRVIPNQRARGLSLFMFGGTLGLGLGPLLSGNIVDQFGLSALIFIGPPIVLFTVFLFLLGRLSVTPPEQETSQQKPTSIFSMLEGRAALAFFLFLVCSLRLVPNMAMDKVLSFTLSQQGETTGMIGAVQAMFLISGSAGMLLMAYRFRTGWEKTFMIACPLAGIPLMLILGWEGCPQWLLLSLLVPTGLILWGTTPAMVSYAHQQFPNGAGLASALTMGIAWGGGGLIQARITSWFQAQGIPQQAFFAFIPCLALSAAGAYFLPATSKQRESSTAPEKSPHKAPSFEETQPAPADA